MNPQTLSRCSDYFKEDDLKPNEDEHNRVLAMPFQFMEKSFNHLFPSQEKSKNYFAFSSNTFL